MWPCEYILRTGFETAERIKARVIEYLAGHGPDKGLRFETAARSEEFLVVSIFLSNHQRRVSSRVRSAGR